jgi:hypothetical protein
MNGLPRHVPSRFQSNSKHNGKQDQADENAVKDHTLESKQPFVRASFMARLQNEINQECGQFHQSCENKLEKHREKIQHASIDRRNAFVTETTYIALLRRSDYCRYFQRWPNGKFSFRAPIETCPGNWIEKIERSVLSRSQTFSLPCKLLRFL